MTIATKAQELKAAFALFIDALANDATSAEAAAPAKTDSGKEAKVTAGTMTKKAFDELFKAAKLKAGSVQKALGKPKLGELLSRVGAKKFAEFKIADAENLKLLIEYADEMLAAPVESGDDDDLLGNDAAENVERTLEDVKGILTAVQNDEDLGRVVVRQILSESGATRLDMLKVKDYAATYESAKKAMAGKGGVL